MNGWVGKGPKIVNGGPIFRRLFFGAPFFWRPFVLAQERKKEATRTWRESRALSPKRSVGLQNTRPYKGWWVAKP